MAPPSERTPLLGNGSGNGSRRASPAEPEQEQEEQQQQQQSSQFVDEMPPLRQLIPVLCSLWVPVFIASLDATVVATLVGSISSDFNASEQSSWLGSSYLLSLCCFNPLVGRMADAFGTRQSLLFSTCIFTLGTLGCGMAPNFASFLVARVIAGAGGGGLTTSTNIHMTKIIPLRSRGLLQGLTNIVFGLGSGLGGPVGGFCDVLLGWRNAFYFQIPLLAIAFGVTIVYVRDEDHERRTASQAADPVTAKLKRIDWLGSFSLVSAVTLLLIPMSLLSGADYALSSPIVYGQLVASLLSVFAFVYIETRVDYPVLPLRLLTDRTIIGVALINFTLSITGFATLYSYPLFFQAVRLQNSSQAGLHLVPYSVALSISSVTAGWYMRQTGRYKKYNTIMSAMQLVSAVILALLQPDSPEWLTYFAIVPMGIGGAGILTCTLIAIINAVDRSEVAVATALTYLFRTTGQVLGVSFSGTILQFTLKSEFEKRLPDRPDLVDAIRHSSKLIPTLPKEVREEASEAYLIGLKNVFWFLASVGVVTLLGSLLLEDRELPDVKKKTDPEEQQQQQQQGEARNDRDS